MSTLNQIYKGFIATPVGVVEITASEQGVTGIVFVQKEFLNKTSLANDSALKNDPLNNKNHAAFITAQCKQQLTGYFAGERTTFDLPLDASGTDFQKSVWEQLLTIKHGTTASYQDVANQLNKPKAVRAVGAANGKNPISIVVPCHRVIGSNNTLTGYAGGLERKSWLLKHEGISL